ERLPQFPGVPTVSESGFSGFEYPVGLGIFVRTGTPSALQDKLNADIRKAMHEPSFVELMGKSATVTTDLSASECKARWARETAGYGELIRKSNIKFE